MLVALDERDRSVLAETAQRGPQYRCPACGAAVVLKQGRRVLPHFAHRPEQPCPVTSEPETAAHVALKLALYEMFKDEPWVHSCTLERVIGQRRADVWLDTAVGPVAVEGQVSPLTVAELAAKLVDYTGRGIATLYVVHGSVLATLAEGAEVRIPAWVLALHALYRGRVYIWDGGRIVPVHFEAVLRENEWSAGPEVRRLKATRTLVLGPVIEQRELRCTLVECRYGPLAGGTYLVAAWGEGVFWRAL